jgi:hypothetical protein
VKRLDKIKTSAVHLTLFSLGALAGWCVSVWLMRRALYGDVRQ